MRKFLLLLLLVCNAAWADITQEHFSFAQVFDVQWYISGSTLNASGFNYLYASVDASGNQNAARLTSGQTSAYAGAGDYLAFFHSSNYPGTYGLGVYSSSGTLVRVLDYTGSFVALANGAIFYNGNNSWGTLFTTAQGYNYGQGGSWTITQSYPSTAYMTNYSPPNTTPLAAGQSAPPAVTVTSRVNSTITTTATSGATVYTYSQPITTTYYSDGSQTVANNGSATLISTTVTGTSGGITTGQQADVTVFNNNVINGSSVYIQQSGNNDNINIQQIGTHNQIGGIGSPYAEIQNGGNNITIKQGNGNAGQNEIDLSVAGGSNTLTITQANDTAGISAGSNYQLINVNGVGNNITATQTNDGGLVGHFAEINVTGSSDTVGLTQANNGQKQAFVTVVGNNNSVTASQSGLGQHYLSIGESGNGNSATVTQTGSTANSATITLINAGSPASVNLTQTGGQSYSISQSCVTNCGTVTVRQGN